MTNERKDEAPGSVPVVLLHGLWMPGLEMSLLQHRLERHGWHCRRFTYTTFLGSVDDSVDALGAVVAELGSPRVHFVAHSLGGLLLRHYFNDRPEAPAGRVVTLGTPHGGSKVAQVLNGLGPLGWMLGNGRRMGLMGDAPAWPPGRDLGVIAGTLSMGLGMVVPGLDSPNDGTVAVAESRCPEMADYLELPVSHMGLVLSEQVAEAASAFLAGGRFPHGVEGDAPE
ncbi:MAG: alpha/beta fold hydrolase [Gammaproteobacteria bacterium]|nr:alpha/beta fold hydrolase [Gammaproteobacteria bacterium]